MDMEKLIFQQTSWWKSGERRLIERLMVENRIPLESLSCEDLLNLVCNEVRLRELVGELVTLDEYQERFPQFSDELATQWMISDFFNDSSALRDGETTSAISGPPKHGKGPDLQDIGSLPKKIGRYEILRELGRGSMGVVFEGYDPELGRSIAIKRLKTPWDITSNERQRFALEAKSIAQLKHPAIVSVYDVGEDQAGPFIAMEYLTGGTLMQRVRMAPLQAKEAAQLLIAIADGISAVHRLKIVHRDLKPGNILLADENSLTAKVTDFGLAKWIEQDATATSSGALVGSPAYMPPEQVYGKSDQIGPAADIYSLGAILYECLTGSPPFRGATIADTLEQVRHQEPVRIRQLVNKIPSDLETITLKCLNKQPEQRYATADALQSDLENFLAGRPIQAKRPNMAERAWKWCLRNRSVAALLGTIIAIINVALIGLATMLWFLKREYDEKLVALRERTGALVEKNSSLDALDAANVELQQRTQFAEQRLYNSQITLAQRALENREFARCEDLLESVKPDTGYSNHTGFEWNWLKKRLHSDLVVERKMGDGEIFGLGFVVQRNALLAVGGTRTTGYATLLSVPDGKVLMNRNYTATINAAACDPTTSRFAFGSGDGKLFVHDAKNLEMEHHSDKGFHFKTMNWSPDGQHLIAGSQHGELCVWSTESWEEIDRVKAEKGPVLRAFYSRDGQRIYTATDWGDEGRHSSQWLLNEQKLTETAEFWDTSLSDEAVGQERVLGMSWGDLIFSNPSDGTIWKRIRISSGPLIQAKYFDNENKMLLALRNDRELRIYDTKSLKHLRSVASHDTLSAIAIDGDTTHVATGDAQGTVRVWKLDHEPLTSDATVSQHSFSTLQFGRRTGELLVGMSGTVMRWDPKWDTLEISDRPTQSASQQIGALRAMTDDASIRVYVKSHDEDSTTMIHVFRPTSKSQLAFKLNYRIFDDCFLLSRSGRYLATRGVDGLLDVFDLTRDSDTALYRLEAPCMTLAISHQEDLLACGTQYGEVRLFRLSDGTRLPNLAEFRSFWAWGIGVAFSPDDRYLAVGTESGNVQVWQMQDRKLVAELTGNRGEVRHVRFFPDGRRLVCDGSGLIRLWDFLAGQELLTLSLPEVDIKKLEVSPDAKRMIALTASGNAYCWSIE
jgi:WD40 repeat protein/predicted Ser/Thr protein kinase